MRSAFAGLVADSEAKRVREEADRRLAEITELRANLLTQVRQIHASEQQKREREFALFVSETLTAIGRTRETLGASSAAILRQLETRVAEVARGAGFYVTGYVGELQVAEREVHTNCAPGQRGRVRVVGVLVGTPTDAELARQALAASAAGYGAAQVWPHGTVLVRTKLQPE